MTGSPPSGDAPDFGEYPLFGELRPHERRELEAHASYSRVENGVEFVRQGEFTRSEFHLVLSGSVAAYRTDAGQTRVLDSLGPGRWFGEVSALSNQPSPATLRAEAPCSLLSLPPKVFRLLYGREGSSFRRQIDDHYRESGLWLHLRTAPVLRGLSEAALKALRHEAEFRWLATDAVIAREGEPADAVFLVRSGAVKCVRRIDGVERILGYHMNNSSFGERCLSSGDRAWRGTYVAMAPTDLVVVPRTALELLPGDLRESLRQRADALATEESGGASETSSSEARAPLGKGETTELEIMVRGQSAKGGEALVIDLERCVRCNACVESCVAVHEDRVPRLSKKGNRVTFEADASHSRYTLATSCYNCQIPGCMMACTFGAIRRDLQGLVRFDSTNCTGCAMCVEACPYDVIRLAAAPASPEPRHGFWESLPLLGRFFREAAPATEAAADSEPKRLAVKCDLCAGLPFQACVYNCPCDAIVRVSPHRLFREKEVRAQGTYSYTQI